MGPHASIAGRPRSFCLPHGHTLIDFINNNINLRAGVWMLPAKHTYELKNEMGLINNNTARDCEVMEIDLAEAIPNMDEALDFLKTKLQETEDIMPILVIALNCPTVKIPLDKSTSKLLNPMTFSFTNDVEFNTVTKEEDKIVILPMKMTFRTNKWMFIINFPFNYDYPIQQATRKLCTKRFNTNPRVAMIINALPTVAGRDIREYIKSLHLIFDIYFIEASLDDYVDIGMLALASGWDVKKTGLFSLHLATTGCMLNTAVRHGDYTWHMPYSHIAPLLQTYHIGKINSIYLVTVVFLAILIRDLFPDPEIYCATAGNGHVEAYAWIGAYIINSIKNLEPKEPQFWNTTTRQDLARGVTCSCGKPGPEFQHFVSLLQDQPTITCGGPRFLIVVRQNFTKIWPTTIQTEYRHHSIRPDLRVWPEKDWKAQTTYGRAHIDLNPGHPVELPGLNPHPQMEGKWVKLHDVLGLDRDNITKTRI